jgi:hypothetical protein
LGINPLSVWGDTPLGIYAYNVSDILKAYPIHAQRSFKSLPVTILFCFPMYKLFMV